MLAVMVMKKWQLLGLRSSPHPVFRGCFAINLRQGLRSFAPLGSTSDP